MSYPVSMSVGHEVPECSWPKRPQQTGLSENSAPNIPMDYHHFPHENCCAYFHTNPNISLKLKLFRVLLQRRPAHRSATPSLSIPAQGTKATAATALQPQGICTMGPTTNNHNSSNSLTHIFFMWIQHNVSQPSPKESFLTVSRLN